MLKTLALSGFRSIDVIDMDHVELSNLNRQFLFRGADVGRPKAQVAAQFIRRRLRHLGVNVTPHVCAIQTLGADFYRQFNFVLAGLDSVEARRWLNSQLHDLVERDVTGEVLPHSVCPLFDGGSEGFKGQARVILPSMTSCFECTLGMLPPAQGSYPMCTLAETPRLPEHCIEYALVKLWPETFPDKPLNPDSQEDIAWIHSKASQRAHLFGIEDVDLALTLGVLQRIVPAVGSTNAFIASALVGEALKLSSYTGPVLNTYLMFMGQDGIYTLTFKSAREDHCVVCRSSTVTWTMPRNATVEGLILRLANDPSLRLKKPSVTGTAFTFLQGPSSLRDAQETKLRLTLRELEDRGSLRSGETLLVTDCSSVLPVKLKLFLS
eukprot:GHVT01049615.1.p1 GENE.GHVT01049615.1~~GHVT01049615.1.p1  ORF type:complete len:380 (-),score=67.02 GHVT01049615.1:98-1237(-)